MPRSVSEKSKDRVLGALRMGFTYDRAAKFAGIARRTIFEIKERDPDYARACEEAYQAGTEKFEDEARRRAIEGTERPIYQGGKLVGHERQYSDRLLEVTLKARAPDKYRERVSTEHSGKIEHRHVDLSKLNDAQLDALEGIVGAAAPAGGDPSGEEKTRH